MICEEDLEVGVVHVVDPHVDCMVFGAGIGGVLYFVEFDIGEILDDLDLLDFSVLSHYAVDEGFVHF